MPPNEGWKGDRRKGWREGDFSDRTQENFPEKKEEPSL